MNAEQLITILIPVYNEEDVLEILLTKLDKVTSDLPFKFEFLFVLFGVVWTPPGPVHDDDRPHTSESTFCLQYVCDLNH